MLNGSSVLVTGGTGSFGQRLVQVLLERFDLKRLVIFSRDELKQSVMAREESAVQNGLEHLGFFHRVASSSVPAYHYLYLTD